MTWLVFSGHEVGVKRKIIFYYFTFQGLRPLVF